MKVITVISLISLDTHYSQHLLTIIKLFTVLASLMLGATVFCEHLSHSLSLPLVTVCDVVPWYRQLQVVITLYYSQHRVTSRSLLTVFTKIMEKKASVNDLRQILQIDVHTTILHTG